MDLVRQQQHPAAALVTPCPCLPPATFLQQQHLGASFTNQARTLQQHHHLPPQRAPRILLSQHLSRQTHQTFPAFIDQNQYIIMNPALDNEHQPFAPGYSSEDAKAMFASDFNDHMSVAGPPNFPQSNYYAPAYNLVSFRPSNSSTRFDSFLSTAPPKVDNYPGIMPLRNTQVDTTQYSSIGDEVWVAPMDPSSPSTVDTDENSPVTPNLDHHSAFFNNYAARYGLPEPRLYSAHTEIYPNPTISGGSFDSLSSSLSACSTSSFHVPFQACDSTGSQASKDLDMNHVSSHVTPVSTFLADPNAHSSVSSQEENATEGDADDDTVSSASSPSVNQPVANTDRDRLLLEMRNRGYSYKEIKRRCHFKEAESTLRGRIRMLTKEKHERVRKPVWQKRDVTLLRRAVAVHQGKVSHGRQTTKIPWLKISEWIRENGASYAFAPATCAKKWSEIVRK